MTRYDAPVIQCDGDDGFCTAWAIDVYTQGASAVNGIPVTEDKPTPGWEVIDGDDYCPSCKGSEDDD